MSSPSEARPAGARSRRLVVVGAGPAGVFAAIRARSLAPSLQVDILEAGRHPLAKVSISGGGRCNVTHACFDPVRLAESYPRGGKALRGLFRRFGPSQTLAWFEERGVPLKTEPDGRVFPVTDDAGTIVACLLDACQSKGVTLHLDCPVRGVQQRDGRLRLAGPSTSWDADVVLLATGSSRAGYALAASLGHHLVPPVPSLFTFKVPDEALVALAGVSVPHVRARLHVEGHPPQVAEGPLLVTHWGLSGPVILRLSAWSARPLHDASYQADLFIDFLPGEGHETLRSRLLDQKTATPRKQVGTTSPVSLPRRLWLALAASQGLAEDSAWGQIPHAALGRLAEHLKKAPFRVNGKGPFKEEFVTAGGVPLSEVDMATMASRACRGLYLAGELLDVDALTGGFNFQHAWSSGWVAGEAIAALAP